MYWVIWSKASLKLKVMTTLSKFIIRGNLENYERGGINCGEITNSLERLFVNPFSSRISLFFLSISPFILLFLMFKWGIEWRSIPELDLINSYCLVCPTTCWYQKENLLIDHCSQPLLPFTPPLSPHLYQCHPWLSDCPLSHCYSLFDAWSCNASNNSARQL